MVKDEKVQALKSSIDEANYWAKTLDKLALKPKPYVILYFPYTRPRQAFCLDRQYNYIGDSPQMWEKVQLGDIVEADNAFMPLFASQRPDWVEELLKRGETHIALWTNYYE